MEHMNPGTYDSNVSLNSLLLWQIDRCTLSHSAENPCFCTSVKALEILIVHLQDKDWNDGIKPLNKWHDEKIDDWNTKWSGKLATSKDALYEMSKIENKFAEKKFEEIMKLLNRKGMFPKEKKEYDEVDDDE